MGYYCPLGTDFNWQQCPPGTYNNDTGLQQESDCKSCIGGKHCSSYAAVEPTGDCDEGHYCEFGVDRPQPILCNNTDINGFCLTPGRVLNIFFLTLCHMTKFYMGMLKACEMTI